MTWQALLAEKRAPKRQLNVSKFLIFVRRHLPSSWHVAEACAGPALCRWTRARTHTGRPSATEAPLVAKHPLAECAQLAGRAPSERASERADSPDHDWAPFGLGRAWALARQSLHNKRVETVGALQLGNRCATGTTMFERAEQQLVAPIGHSQLALSSLGDIGPSLAEREHREPLVCCHLFASYCCSGN